MNLIMKYMTRSIAEELEDVPEEAIGPYFEQIGKIVSWIGTGDDATLPDGLREFLSARMGTDIPGTDSVLPEIASGDAGNGRTYDEDAVELEFEAQGY